MALIMVTSLFPTDKIGEGQKIYNEIQEKHPLPSFIKQKQGGMRWVSSGVKGVAFYEVEKGHIAEGLNFIINMKENLLESLDSQTKSKYS